MVFVRDFGDLIIVGLLLVPSLILFFGSEDASDSRLGERYHLLLSSVYFIAFVA